MKATTATATAPALEIDELNVGYGKAAVVTDVSLRAHAGQIISVIGPNGAGKSSCLNAIMGILPPYGVVHGSIKLNGEDITRLPVETRVGRGLSLVPERRELFSSMSVANNLILGAQKRRRSAGRAWFDQIEFVYALFPRLKERSGQLAGTLSGGERQMLALGRALMIKPDVLMLDEPSLGLAPRVVDEVLRVVSELRATQMAIVLVEQNARAALRISDYAYVLENGQITLEGAAGDLASNPRVIQAYLGVGKSMTMSCC